MKIYKKIIILIILAIVFGFVFFYLSLPKNKACFGQDCFLVEIADTIAKREKGLMFVDSLAKDSGMLFVFEKEGIYPFWMKNTLISLDIIWIDENYKIVFMSENTQPCKESNCPLINPAGPAKYVLEINAGKVKEFGIKISDLVQISPGL